MQTKAILKTGMALLIVSGLSLNLFATDGPNGSTSTTLKENATASMQFEVPSNLNTYVLILDQEGKAIHSDMISKDSYANKKYDFSKLENGEYTFRTETEFKSVEKKVVVADRELNVVKEESSYHPAFTVDGDYLLVNYFNANKDEISLVLEDATARYFKEKGADDLSYGKKIDIKRLKMGKYTLALTSGGNTYNYYFNR